MSKIFDLIDHWITCPYCFEEIEIIVDASVVKQSYIEDCSVCCRPMNLEIEVRSEFEVQVEAKR